MTAQTLPQPIPHDTKPTRTRDARFWDRIARKYAAKPVSDQAAYETKLQMTRAHLTPQMEVLEFGCGTGTTALSHAPHVRHILATDLSGEMLAVAREKAAAAQIENVTFQQTSIEDLTAEEQRFDMVMAHSILHLLEDRDAVIAKTHALLKPGGVFVSSTVCLGDWLAIFGLIAPIGRWLGIFPLVKVVRGEEIRASLSHQRFEIVEDFQPTKKAGLFLIARKPG
ncbi:MAG: class I SAM-dependent methyltransferase [Pseudomonadota bacterium]